MDVCKQTAGKIATGVALCILSPIVLILLAGLAECGTMKISEDAVGAIGVCILLVLIAGAVALFILTGMKLGKYEYMEKERLALQYGVQGIVEKKKEMFSKVYQRGIVCGVTLCILAVIPLLVGAAFEANDMIIIYCVIGMLVLVALGVFGIVQVSCVQEAFEKLLQEGDYTIENKSIAKKTKFLSIAYWCIAVAVFLIISNMNHGAIDWTYIGLYWPVVALVFVAVKAVWKSIVSSKKSRE